jgi:hypothetical protein
LNVIEVALDSDFGAGAGAGAGELMLLNRATASSTLDERDALDMALEVEQSDSPVNDGTSGAGILSRSHPGGVGGADWPTRGNVIVASRGWWSLSALRVRVPVSREQEEFELEMSEDSTCSEECF